MTAPQQASPFAPLTWHGAGLRDCREVIMKLDLQRVDEQDMRLLPASAQEEKELLAEFRPQRGVVEPQQLRGDSGEFDVVQGGSLQTMPNGGSRPRISGMR